MANTKTATAKRKKPVSKTTVKKPVKKTKADQKPATKAKIKPREPIKKTRINQNKNEVATIETNREIAIPESIIDFCGVDLLPRQRHFLTLYLTPGSPCFHNALQAALKAGYARDTASCNVYKLLREPVIQKILKTNEGIAQQDLSEAAKRAMELKKQRAFYDPQDFFIQKEIEIETKKGVIIKKVLELKPIDEMTELQRMCIDGLDVKGQASIPVYIMADREKSLNDILKMDKELSGINKTNGQDIEELKEVIIERVTVRQLKRSSVEDAFIARILDRPDGRGEEEL